MVSLPVKIPPQILLKESAKLASACYTISTIFAIWLCIKLRSMRNALDAELNLWDDFHVIATTIAGEIKSHVYGKREIEVENFSQQKISR